MPSVGAARRPADTGCVAGDARALVDEVPEQAG